jgi:signal transduction histidine kinase
VLKDGGECWYLDEDAIGPFWKGKKFPLESCVSGLAMLHREAVTIPDIYQDPRVPHDAYRPTFVQSLAMVPIRTLDPIGAIGNYWATPHEATRRELRLLQALADSTAVAMERVQIELELEQRVIDRTAALQEANAGIQGLHDEVTARAARTSSAIRVLAHEVRGALSGGDLLLSLHLEEGGLPPALGDDILLVQASVQEAVRVVNDQLEASRLEAGAARVHPSDFQLEELLGGLRGVCRALRRNDSVALVIEDTSALPQLRTDRNLLGQILRNLLTNALKFTDRGEVRLSAAIDEERVHITVSDTGVGIAPEDQARVWEEFLQVEQTQATRHQGSGLGLPLVRRLCELLGGSITLRSEPGRGSSFTVTLPRRVPPP